MVDIRVTNDGGKHPDGLNAKAQYGSLFIDDATGFVSASTPSAEVIDAAPVTAGEVNGVTAAIASGSLTIDRPGHYDIFMNAGSVLGGNASVITLEIQKNGAAIASGASALGGALTAIIKMQSTAAADSCVIQGRRKLAKGDVIRGVCTGTVGTVTIKQYELGVRQVSDA